MITKKNIHVILLFISLFSAPVLIFLIIITKNMTFILAPLIITVSFVIHTTTIIVYMITINYNYYAIMIFFYIFIGYVSDSLLLYSDDFIVEIMILILMLIANIFVLFSQIMYPYYHNYRPSRNIYKNSIYSCEYLIYLIMIVLINIIISSGVNNHLNPNEKYINFVFLLFFCINNIVIFMIAPFSICRFCSTIRYESDIPKMVFFVSIILIISYTVTFLLLSTTITMAITIVKNSLLTFSIRRNYQSINTEIHGEGEAYV